MIFMVRRLSDIQTRKSDIFVVSYPRSGNSWVRFMLSTYLHDIKTDWTNFKEHCPMMYHTDNISLNRIKSPRVIGSHELYDQVPNSVYIIRDPRDVMISQYFYNLKRGHIDCEFDEWFDRFVNEKPRSFGSWKENVKSWFNHADYFIFYEHLLEDTHQELENIICNVTDTNTFNRDRIDKSVEWCRFENMKRLEHKQGYLKSESKRNIPFMRKGKSKQWQVFLSNDQQNIFYNKFKGILDTLNYDK